LLPFLAPATVLQPLMAQPDAQFPCVNSIGYSLASYPAGNGNTTT